MANFFKAFKKVVFYEGGYVNDPDDNGGETYMGISRKANPKWKGWELIDIHKSKNPTKFKKLLKEDIVITQLVATIYKKNYWDILYLDNVKNEKAAFLIFDTAVNMGVSKAIKIMQKTMGVKETGILDYTTRLKLRNL